MVATGTIKHPRRSAGTLWRAGTSRGTALGMARHARTTLAGGFPIALGALGGTVVGIIARQPSAGFLAGLGAGVALAVSIWLLDRRR